MPHKKLSVASLVLALLAITGTALAHPLGNFTTNLHLGLTLAPDSLSVTLVVDMAEIPAFREMRLVDSSGDDVVSAAESTEYAASACESHRHQILLQIQGGPLALETGVATLIFPPGQGGLDTLRLECDYEVPLPVERGELIIENGVYSDRLGWSEIVVRSEALAIETPLPSQSPSAVLTSYPVGPTIDDRRGLVSFSPGLGTASPEAGNSGDGRPTLVERIGSGVVGGSGPIALLAALTLGAGHALAPGHGKTLMTAYLVGRRGSPRLAVGLGLSVALAHTIGVAALGVITALTTSVFQPETVYPWLSLLSALIVVSIGVVMVYRATRQGGGRNHDHSLDDDHSHHAHSHDREVDGHTDEVFRRGGWRSLAALGLAGGLVPSASAVVLLLGAIAQGEAWWGLILVAGFGLGMSATLIGAGLLAVAAQQWGWTRVRSERFRRAWERRIPLLGGLAVTLIGLWLFWDTSRRFFY